MDWALEHPRHTQHIEEIYIKINQLNSQFFFCSSPAPHQWHYKFMPVMIRVMKIFQNVNKNYIIYGKNPRLWLSSCNDTKKMWNFFFLLLLFSSHLKSSSLPCLTHRTTLFSFFFTTVVDVHITMMLLHCTDKAENLCRLISFLMLLSKLT